MYNNPKKCYNNSTVLAIKYTTISIETRVVLKHPTIILKTIKLLYSTECMCNKTLMYYWVDNHSLNFKETFNFFKRF